MSTSTNTAQDASTTLLRSARLPNFYNAEILLRHWADESYDCHVRAWTAPNTSVLRCTYPHTTPRRAITEAWQIVLYERWLEETKDSEVLWAGDIRWTEATTNKDED